MRITAVLPLILATAAIARPSAEPGLIVTTAGSEQALKLGEAVIPRPFGAQLVDSIAVIGRYGSARHRFFLVEGTGGASCPARYVVVRAGVGRPPLVSAPFGTCAPGASGRLDQDGLLISVAPGLGGTRPVRYLYAQGSVRPIDPEPAAATARAIPTRCKNPNTLPAAERADVRGQLDQTLPAVYRRMSDLRRISIAPAELDQVVAGLVCLSAWPGATRVVARAATPLFASRDHGDDAFGALDRFATASASDIGLRASAREFAATMRYYVAKREPI